MDKPMKHFKCCVVVSFFALISSPLYSQDSQSNYVTIGVFRVLDNAVRFTEMANKNGFNAQYALNPKYDLYYVYLLNEEDKMKAYIFMSKIRKETDYKDAWIFVGALGAEQQTVIATANSVGFQCSTRERKMAMRATIFERRCDAVRPEQNHWNVQ